MNLKLVNKNALICASSAGIGKGIATELAKEGANVSILGRDESKLAKATEEISRVAKGKVMSSQCDLNDFSAIERVYNQTHSTFGAIDILINNQGGPLPGNFEDISLEETQVALNTNLLSVLHITKLCLQDMKQSQFGRIVNILSVSAKEPIPNMFLSNTIRPAVLGFAKSISTNYADQGITVNSLLPNAVLSDRTSYFVNKSAEEQNITFEEALELAGKNLPTKYIATPEEFAKIAVFLCSPIASYINGTSICVDGGASKGLY